MFRLINKSINNNNSNNIIKLNKNNIINRFCSTTTTTSINKDNVYDLIIIGGGLVGSSMACAIGNNKSTKHLKVALIESSKIQSVEETISNPIPDIRTISFNNQTIQLFKSIDVWDTIKSTKRINPFNQVRVWDTSGFEGIHFQDKDIDNNNNNNNNNTTMGYIIENNIVTSSILAKVKEFDNIELFQQLSVKCLNDYDQETIKSTSILPSVTLSNDQQLHGKLIIGADGGNSILKKQLQVPSMGRVYNQKAVVCTLKLGEQQQPNNTLFQRFLPTGPIALLPLANGYANIIWSTNLIHAQYLLELDDESFLEQVKDSFLKSPSTSNSSFFDIASNLLNLNPKGLSGNEIYMPPIESLVSKRASFPLRIDHTFNYTLPRVCFIGDASHLVHPMAGQGVNLGMADVKALSEIIQQSVQSGYDIGDPMMLKRFEEIRKPENLKMLLSIDTLFNLFTNNSILVTGIRNFGMSLLNNISPLKTLIIGVSKGEPILKFK
ncbi:hypothetical protein RB653_005058 [Dictyostelium firmibasis]|uniref:Ubiquinone biosynthesis monooxygenase COQ6, mitochondrial n=1 Tax=Dictyostelium firmibasis TaxID=79012 RepID=A0AAN7U6W6_9MYCE